MLEPALILALTLTTAGVSSAPETALQVTHSDQLYKNHRVPGRYGERTWGVEVWQAVGVVD